MSEYHRTIASMLGIGSERQGRFSSPDRCRIDKALKESMSVKTSSITSKYVYSKELHKEICEDMNLSFFFALFVCLFGLDLAIYIIVAGNKLPHEHHARQRLIRGLAIFFSKTVVGVDTTPHNEICFVFEQKPLRVWC